MVRALYWKASLSKTVLLIFTIFGEVVLHYLKHQHITCLALSPKDVLAVGVGRVSSPNPLSLLSSRDNAGVVLAEVFCEGVFNSCFLTITTGLRDSAPPLDDAPIIPPATPPSTCSHGGSRRCLLKRSLK